MIFFPPAAFVGSLLGFSIANAQEDGRGDTLQQRVKALIAAEESDREIRREFVEFIHAGKHSRFRAPKPSRRDKKKRIQRRKSQRINRK